MWREGVEEKRQKDQKLPGETEMWRTKAGRAGKRPGRPSGSLIHSCRSGPSRRGKAGLMRLQGLVSVGDDLDSAASSRVSSGDGEGETGLLQAGVPPLLPLQMQGLLLLTQSLPPSGSGPGRSCCFLESQDGGLLRFSLRRSHPLSHRWGN